MDGGDREDEQFTIEGETETQVAIDITTMLQLELS